MGKMNKVMCHYISDKRRFADLFNGVFFGGAGVVEPAMLSEASEQYAEVEAEKGKRLERIRDVKMCMRSGAALRVLAVENQSLVDYTMPFRCMQYDTMDYRRQIEDLRNKNAVEGGLAAASEKLCGLRKEDRLVPVYTLCLYHGEEAWDGPRSLRDMMAFTGLSDMEEWFSDYPMKLFCINENTDFSMFHTQLREVFSTLKYRRDREGFHRLLKEDAAYRRLERDTVETMSVLLNMPKIWEQRERYMCAEEEEEYDMCQAIQEWLQEERQEGIQEGRQEGIQEGRQEGIQEGIREGIRVLVETCREFGASREFTARKVAQKHNLESAEAEKCVEQYW